MSSIDLPVIPEAPEPRAGGSLVVRYGYLRFLGQLPWDGEAPSSCDARIVIRTKRGTELAEVLTTACSNAACPRSITPESLRQYVDNSGGTDFPLAADGRVLRIATPEDLTEWDHVQGQRPQYISTCQQLVEELNLPMKLVEAEPILGGEMVTFYFMSEHRVDFRILVKELATRFRTRIQMHQVGARDEARLVADYETCGEQCCCRQFLKVLKPISMGSAKMQKATLDPGKISGRCGRLKCCLRYEEEAYDDLRRRLPRVNSRVRTSEGAGTVLETMILTQLVRVRLEDDRVIAVANEELLERDLPLLPRADRPQPVESRTASPAAGAPPSSRRAPSRRDSRRRPPAAPQPQEIQPETSTAESEVASPVESEVQPSTLPGPIPSDQASAMTPPTPASAAASSTAQNPSTPPGVGMMGRRRRRGRGRSR